MQTDLKKGYNARPFLEKIIFSQLKNLAFVLGAKTECGTVVWNDDIDIAPEHLYECPKPVDDVFGAWKAVFPREQTYPSDIIHFSKGDNHKPM